MIITSVSFSALTKGTAEHDEMRSAPTVWITENLTYISFESSRFYLVRTQAAYRIGYSLFDNTDLMKS